MMNTWHPRDCRASMNDQYEDDCDCGAWQHGIEYQVCYWHEVPLGPNGECLVCQYADDNERMFA